MGRSSGPLTNNQEKEEEDQLYLQIVLPFSPANGLVLVHIIARSSLLSSSSIDLAVEQLWIS